MIQALNDMQAILDTTNNDMQKRKLNIPHHIKPHSYNERTEKGQYFDKSSKLVEMEISVFYKMYFKTQLTHLNSNLRYRSVWRTKTIYHEVLDTLIEN